MMVGLDKRLKAFSPSESTALEVLVSLSDLIVVNVVHQDWSAKA